MAGKRDAARRLLALTAGLGPAAVVAAESAVNMPRGVTPMSRDVYDLHMIVLWIVTIVGIAVFGVIVYSIIRHRRSRGVEAAQFHGSTKVEVVWTLIPFAILVAIAVPATITLLDMEDTSDPDVTVKVTGWQWKWQYEYLDEGIAFFSNMATPREQIENRAAKGGNYLLEVDNPLVVPVDSKIRFLMTSNDVIHSWWVPQLAVKKDAIPGFINEAWARIDEPGVYRGQCAELCGKDHGFMPVVVKAVPKEEYREWVAARKAASAEAEAAAGRELSMEDLMARGKKVYDSRCASCHLASGEGVPGAFPALKGSAIATGDIGAHIDIVLHGKSGTAMQAFGPQLDDIELAAVITYERNAWDNDAGDMVQPADIDAAR